VTHVRLLEGLDPAQREAVTNPGLPLRILAPAGSGKTRVLTRRIAYGVETDRVDPERVLAVTFTRKAAAELRQRLSALGLPATVAAGTFHSAAWAQLRQWWSDQGVEPPSLLPSRSGFLRRVARAEGVRLGDAGTEIDWACARMIGPARYGVEAARAGRRPVAHPDQVAHLYRSYEATKRRKRVVDFDDILRMVVHTLDTQPERAKVLRWRFRHFFVDEFQDVNPLQFRLLEAWLGDRDDLCVVGDPHQAIYRWNGADAGFLNDFDEVFPGSTTVSLDRNYRSSAGVLAVARAVLPAPDAPEVMADPGPVPEVWRFATGADEAQAIAERLRAGRLAGRSWGQHGVLVRTHGQAAVIGEALAAMGIPYRIRGATGSATHSDVKEIFDALPADTPLHVALVDWMTDEAEGRGGPVLETLVRLGREFQAMQPEAGIDEFVTWVTSMVGDDRDEAANQVDVATLHAAKGLEWDTVILAGLEEGLVPISHAETGAELAEEQRLLYVGVTRARRMLICSWAAQRKFGSRNSRREPSRWLGQIQRTIDDMNQDDRPVPPPEAVIDLRRPAPTPNEQLRRRLDDWRVATARRSSALPAAVLTDHLLDRVTETAPRDLDALAALGFGPSHRRLYGAEICAMVDDVLNDPAVTT
jgi:DNA helicase-2/ATP-dependent DNA helicase PcrA